MDHGLRPDSSVMFESMPVYPAACEPGLCALFEEDESEAESWKDDRVESGEIMGFATGRPGSGDSAAFALPARPAWSW